MNHQVFIFALVFSMMFMTASASSECFVRCMACLMINDKYCQMDVAYTSGGVSCLRLCYTNEASLERGSIYSVINALRKCRNSDKDTDMCVHKLLLEQVYRERRMGF